MSTTTVVQTIRTTTAAGESSVATQHSILTPGEALKKVSQVTPEYTPPADDVVVSTMTITDY